MKRKAWICRSEYFAVLYLVQVDSHFRGLHSSVPVIAHPCPPQHSSWAGALNFCIDRYEKKVQITTCCCWFYNHLCWVFFSTECRRSVSYFEIVRGWLEPDLLLPFLRQFCFMFSNKLFCWIPQWCCKHPSRSFHCWMYITIVSLYKKCLIKVQNTFVQPGMSPPSNVTMCA